MPELGRKYTCYSCHTKFYDLGKDPIVSPYTGKSYPRSYFETTAKGRIVPERAVEEEEEEAEVEEVVADAAAPEIVSLDEVETEEAAEEDIPEVEDVEEAEDIGDDEPDVFLEEEDEDEDLDFDVGGGDER